MLLTVSNGPRGGRAAIYRTALEPGSAFERCTRGLPDWFDGNIDTGCLSALDDTAVFGTVDGEVYVSEDAGSSWRKIAREFGEIRTAVWAPN